MKSFKPTEFGYISSEIDLGSLHLGKQKLFPDVSNPGNSEVIINIKFLSKEKINKKINPLFHERPIECYFDFGGKVYYRNMNALSNIEGGEVYYKGKLPNSFLSVEISRGRNGFEATVEVTKSYLFENRSRFTDNEPFEDFIDNLFITLSILQNKAVMHAASVKIGNETLLLIGYPNTGKTTTSSSLYSNTSNIDYIAEDMCFVDPEDLTVYSCPYTSAKHKSTLHTHKPVTRVIGLKKSGEENGIEERNTEECFRFVHRMNLYEYNWDQNIILRHLFMGEGVFNQSDISTTYVNQLKELSRKVNFAVLGGNNVHEWTPLLKNFLGISEDKDSKQV